MTQFAELLKQFESKPILPQRTHQVHKRYSSFSSGTTNTNTKKLPNNQNQKRQSPKLFRQNKKRTEKKGIQTNSRRKPPQLPKRQLKFDTIKAKKNNYFGINPQEAKLKKVGVKKEPKPQYIRRGQKQNKINQTTNKQKVNKFQPVNKQTENKRKEIKKLPKHDNKQQQNNSFKILPVSEYYVQAIAPFYKIEEVDLGFKLNEFLLVKATHKSGWLIAQNKSGKIGLIPNNYVIKTENVQLAKQYKAIKDNFIDDNTKSKYNQINCKKDDIFERIAKVNEYWIYAKNIQTNEKGYVPRNCIHKIK
ncbi:nephrocystin-1 [Anaeramoeba flamelloides]|uniref:Nephrocystin-1 n=1 Tax=Anaeramoeba flamelloides TaxID=1746091 RepID=A0AAV7YVB0_9EUKA|nr:nephrocystin-1 [Anaeramoeba flamelloides]